MGTLRKIQIWKKLEVLFRNEKKILDPRYHGITGSGVEMKKVLLVEDNPDL